MGHVRLKLVGVILPAIAKSPALARGIGDLVHSGGHAERDHDLRTDIFGIGPTRDVGDDPAEQGVTEVRIFHRGPGRPAHRHAVAKHPGEIGLGQRLLTIPPGIVGDEPADMAQQIANADPRGIAGRISPVAKLRHIGFGRRIERETALVAKFQDRQSGEGLRHRRDPEQAVRGDGTVMLEILDPHRPDMGQPPVADDTVDQARNVARFHELTKMRVDGGNDVGHRRSGRGRRARSLRQSRRAHSQQQGCGQRPEHGDPLRHVRSCAHHCSFPCSRCGCKPTEP